MILARLLKVTFIRRLKSTACHANIKLILTQLPMMLQYRNTSFDALLNKSRINLSHLIELLSKRQKLLEEYDVIEELRRESSGQTWIAEEAEKLQSSLANLDEDLENIICNTNLESASLELRPAVGGEESSLFKEELLEAYRKLFKFTNSPFRDCEAGLILEGQACEMMKYEVGVHRIQRVPATESKGRVHTSTITVALVGINKEIQAEIDEKDVRVDVFRASGPGGQNLHKTNSAVRVVHLSTGITVSIQDERSQVQNRIKAMGILKTRLAAHLRSNELTKTRQERGSQIGDAQRSNKIRTYNYSRDLIIDHRVPDLNIQCKDFLAGNEASFMKLYYALRQNDFAMKLQSIYSILKEAQTISGSGQ